MPQYSSVRSRLFGVFAPTITGYHPDESISEEATRQFVRFLLDQGVDGLVPLGSAGEPVALTSEERKQLLTVIVEETAGKVPIFAGTADYSTASTIELSLHAKSLGCDGLMLMPPFLMRPPKQDVLTHFRRVRDRVGLPIMVYNVPSHTGVEVTPEEIKALADDDVVHAVKWSHLEASRIHDTRLLCGSEFPIFAGIDVIAFEALAAGAALPVNWLCGRCWLGFWTRVHAYRRCGSRKYMRPAPCSASSAASTRTTSMPISVG